MGEQVHPTLDEDLYQQVLEEHRESGRPKSQVINDRVRAGYNGTDPTLADTLLPIFGQGLFVAGLLWAVFAMLLPGLGMAAVGTGLMIGAKVDEFMEKHEVPAMTALVKVLGA